MWSKNHLATYTWVIEFVAPDCLFFFYMGHRIVILGLTWSLTGLYVAREHADSRVMMLRKQQAP